MIMINRIFVVVAFRAQTCLNAVNQQAMPRSFQEEKNPTAYRLVEDLILLVKLVAFVRAASRASWHCISTVLIAIRGEARTGKPLRD
jgi:hypothetical protein